MVSNSEGDVTSDAAILVVEPGLFAPSIVTQPADLSVAAGEAAAFSVVADGNPSPNYQWRRDGADLPDETGATLQIANVSTADAGVYDVVVSNSEGNLISNLATLEVVTDTVLPTLVSATVVNSTTLALRFSEPMTSSVELLANYSIDQDVQVLSTQQNAADEVTLITSGFEEAVNYTVTVSDVQDLAFNTIAANTTASFSLPVSSVEFAFIVSNPGSLNTADETVQEILEELGHSVVLVDDNVASPATTGASQAVIISSTVSHTRLNDIFLGDSRPVFVWEYHLLDDLGLTLPGEQGRESVNNRNINLVDTSTGIGSGSDVGLFQLTVGNRRDGWGIPGADAVVIATLENDSSRATIFSYEAGDARPGGGVFAGRRLAWPHGWAETFTTEGATLFEQSIGWLLEGLSLIHISEPTRPY